MAQLPVTANMGREYVRVKTGIKFFSQGQTSIALLLPLSHHIRDEFRIHSSIDRRTALGSHYLIYFAPYGGYFQVENWKGWVTDQRYAIATADSIIHPHAGRSLTCQKKKLSNLRIRSRLSIPSIRGTLRHVLRLKLFCAEQFIPGFRASVGWSIDQSSLWAPFQPPLPRWKSDPRWRRLRSRSKLSFLRGSSSISTIHIPSAPAPAPARTSPQPRLSASTRPTEEARVSLAGACNLTSPRHKQPSGFLLRRYLRRCSSWLLHDLPVALRAPLATALPAPIIPVNVPRSAISYTSNINSSSALACCLLILTRLNSLVTVLSLRFQVST
ncbi:hypothetical protein CEP54_004210 [Fusarium duplospermum]|uniref:Uncharacterized protein n=1 Tax=Fusarium duplospermum TaxID=1325734 RepID=A0A428QJA5_9HYPO|nr:hypothetical protein CEP54_004210 [Fusarium duplospermum]